MKQQLAVVTGLAMVMCWGGSSTVVAQSASVVTDPNINRSPINPDTAQPQFKPDQREEDARQREIRAEEEAELPEAQLPSRDLRHNESSLFSDHKDVSHDTDDLDRIPH